MKRDLKKHVDVTITDSKVQKLHDKGSPRKADIAN
jgi:hypothetical protein